MSRLPIPGGDSGNWGVILNDYLSVSLGSDGSIQPQAIHAAGGVTSINTINPNSSGAVTLTAASVGALSSTASAGGDLSGNYPNPTVTSTHLASALPVNQGGTGSSTQNFIDLTTSQTATGAKTFQQLTVTAVIGSGNSASFNVDDTANGGRSYGVVSTAAGNFVIYDNSDSAHVADFYPNYNSSGGFGMDVRGSVIADKAFLSGSIATLTDGATISLDASQGNTFAVTLGGNRALANPTNPTDGQTIRVRVIQDATGNRTLTYGTAYDFGLSGAPTLSTGANKVDILGFEYIASLSKWCYLGAGLGF